MRPATHEMLDSAAVRVMYLLQLRTQLHEKMLIDFINGVDIYLGLHRDALRDRLTCLQVTEIVLSLDSNLSRVHLPIGERVTILWYTTSNSTMYF